MQIDFFFDPVCPWAWITSRWVEEVAARRPLDVDWRFIALRIVNEHRDYEREFPPGYVEGHNLGLQLLRVAAAVKAEHGNEAVARWYTALGERIHVAREAPSLRSADGVRALLESVDLPGSLTAAADDESWEEPVRADTEEGLERTGRDIGTPIITFDAPDGPSFFGPVISRIPRGDEAIELWESTERLARFPGFAELKRSVRERPRTS